MVNAALLFTDDPSEYETEIEDEEDFDKFTTNIQIAENLGYELVGTLINHQDKRVLYAFQPAEEDSETLLLSPFNLQCLTIELLNSSLGATDCSHLS